MKGLFASLFILAFALALVPAVSSGAAAPFTTPTTPIHHFVVTAHSGPEGISGIFSLSSPANPLLDFTGRVTCLDVVGDHAIVGGVVTGGGEPGQIGTGFAVGFIDGGSGSDRQTFTDVEIAAPVDCAAEQSLFTLMLFPVLNGNVVVNG
ncbi:MAG: hypothetical protein E6G57_17945 [Actinobacteria bacterium]|nr:MAG: hypothetical protein E6G57_17945 [Actinomycetota bacterium]